MDDKQRGWRMVCERVMYVNVAQGVAHLQHAVLVGALHVRLDQRVRVLHALPLPPRSRRRVGGGALLQTEHLTVEPIGG